ncbi:MAG: hypothetical protein ACRDGI_09635, partial [Candidatus Limnocylindrales bacterium]
MTNERPAGSFFDMRTNRRDERDFAREVDAAFAPDPAAIARVRAAVLAQAPNLIKVEPRHATRWSAGPLAWRTAALAIVLLVAVAGGFAIVNLRTAPAGGSIAGATTPSTAGSSAIASTSIANEAPADIDRSQASLASVVTTAKSGNAAALAVVLVTYEPNLTAIAVDLRRPGADLSAARARLVTQAADLASIASSVTGPNA